MRLAIAIAGTMLVLAASPAVATAQHGLRIVGGTPVPAPVATPWNVIVSSADEVCTGTLIDLSRVLTAASCVFADETLRTPQALAAAAGFVRNDPGADLSAAQLSAVSAVRVHPAEGDRRYALAGRTDEDSLAYDLALLTLSKPFALTAQVAPVTLAQSPPRLRSVVSIFGWGLLKFGTDEAFDVARGMTARTTRATRCSDGVPSVLCTVSSRQTPCFGDNGAGVVTGGSPRTLVGIHSFQDAKCVAGETSGAISTTDPGVALWLRGSDNPPLAPSARRLPTIDLAGPRERQIVCRPPTWRGATKVRTAFVDRDTHRTLKSGPSRLYRPLGQARRRWIYCVSIASNRGGVTESRTRNIVRVGVQ